MEKDFAPAVYHIAGKKEPGELENITGIAKQALIIVPFAEAPFL